MKIVKTNIENLQFITVTNSSGMSVVFSTLGASIYSIKINDEYMTLTPKNLDDFKSLNIYHGKTIGRFGNRIANGKIMVEGKEYNLEKNEGNNTLHGGFHSISAAFFDYVIKNCDDGVEVIFHYLSPDMEGGFPGNLDIKVTYFINENENTVKVSYEAVTDKTTPIGLTNHSYFSLGLDNDLDLELFINANTYIIPNEKDLLPKGRNQVPYYLDFSKPSMIKKYIDLPVLQNHRSHGYDHHFFFTNLIEDKPQIILKSNKYTLEIYTDFKGLQIYTDNFEDNISFYQTNNNIHRAIALEPQNGFDVLELLKPNQIYKHYFIYKFI